MKYKKILAVFLTVLTVLTMFTVSAFALTWDGSSAGGSTNAVNGSATGYVIRSTNDSNCVVGYRFSVVNEAGNMKVKIQATVTMRIRPRQSLQLSIIKSSLSQTKMQSLQHQ